MTRKPNRLIVEKSPYLLQFAYSPVNWYPWGEDGFYQAKKENKPIFLSIGYSTCHACHRMAKECFEDEEVATILNEHYIAILVDREERPDIEQIYMEMAQIMSGKVGWPLTVIMTPNRVPFFASTYIPKEGDGKGRGLVEILNLFYTKWCVRKDELMVTVDRVQDYFRIRSEQNMTSPLDDILLKQAFDKISELYDGEYGGFGETTKFPLPHYLHFLLRYGLFMDESDAITMLENTLKGMYRGGLYDHLGGGFARYAVSRNWLIPNFEKMAEDNALLLRVYLEAYRLTQNPLYFKIAKETIEFIKRELLGPEGVFYTAIDADYEGIEGKYYIWEEKELHTLLTEEEYSLFNRYYSLEVGRFKNGFILNRLLAADSELSSEPSTISKIKDKLLSHRQTRSRPHVDRKILSKVNGMMITSFVQYFMTTDEETALTIAEATAQFILDHLIDDRGRLYARYIDGERKYYAYADDYAYLIEAFITLFLATGKVHYIEYALTFLEDMMAYYTDGEPLAFYFTAKDSESLLYRHQDAFDGSTPSANAVMAMNLLLLAEIIDHPKLEEQAITLLEKFGKQIAKYLDFHIHSLTAYLYYKIPKRKIVLVTEKITPEVKTLQRMIWTKCAPCTLMITLQREKIKHSPHFSFYLEDPHPLALYICENYQCNDPIYSFEEMVQVLEQLFQY